MSKERAIRKSFKDEVGMARYELIKAAFDRIQDARDQGYYLEAITIIESMIADRLESAISDAENTNIGFQTLGSLILLAHRSHKLDAQLKIFIITELKAWKKRRNIALHEMVKLEKGNLHTWPERYAELLADVDSGFELLKKIMKRMKEIRKPKK